MIFIDSLICTSRLRGFAGDFKMIPVALGIILNKYACGHTTRIPTITNVFVLAQFLGSNPRANRDQQCSYCHLRAAGQPVDVYAEKRMNSYTRTEKVLPSNGPCIFVCYWMHLSARHGVMSRTVFFKINRRFSERRKQGNDDAAELQLAVKNDGWEMEQVDQGEIKFLIF